MENGGENRNFSKYEKDPQSLPRNFSSGQQMPSLHPAVLILGQERCMECRTLDVQYCRIGCNHPEGTKCQIKLAPREIDTVLG